MKYWSPWQSSGTSKKFQVKVSQLKLEGFECVTSKGNAEEERCKSMAIEVKWKGPKVSGGLLTVPYFSGRSSQSRRDFTGRRDFDSGGGEYSVEWDDEFESLCNFPPNKDGSFGSWYLGFSLLLYGKRGAGESKNKMAVLGKVSLNLMEIASRMEPEIQRKLPIVLKFAGKTSEATLSVCASLMELRDNNNNNNDNNPDESSSMVEDSTISVTGRTSFMNKFTYFKTFRRIGNGAKAHQEEACSETDESNPVDNSERPPGNASNAPTVVGSEEGSTQSTTELETAAGSETEFDPLTKSGLLLSKRRRLGFNPPWENEEDPLTKGAFSVKDDEAKCSSGSFRLRPTLKADTSGLSTKLDYWRKGYCQTKEIVSRDGQTKLKTDIFFATFDQRSKFVAGESACSALAVFNAHWLHSNPNLLPSKVEFNNLILRGSRAWQRLCTNADYLTCFPDRHFDLETVIDANIKPLALCPKKSLVGFFGTEKLESLKEAMSFDNIWDELTKDYMFCDPRIYVVSWNDHFFVLKMEEDAYYVMDSLGARLFVGCDQAYILKFDDSSVIYELEKEAKDDTHEISKPICTGKDCCREFFKRFLAAIVLRDLEEDFKKGRISTCALYRHLQIDFHYSHLILPPSPPLSSLLSSSCDESSSTLSVYSSEEEST